MAVNLDVFLVNLLIHVVVNIILLSPVLWISGRLLAGKEKARFLDALWIAILGTVNSRFAWNLCLWNYRHANRASYLGGFDKTLLRLRMVESSGNRHRGNNNAGSNCHNIGTARHSRTDTDIAIAKTLCFFSSRLHVRALSSLVYVSDQEQPTFLNRSDNV